MSSVVERCSFCRGSLAPGTTTLDIWRDDQLVVIRDIPADVCGQCKEPLLSAEVSRKLDHFFKERHRFRPEKYLTVPQYSAAQFMGDS
jgi:YgiT-type zinc finger domain-containing protein